MIVEMIGRLGVIFRVAHLVADQCQGKWAAYRLVSAVVGIFTVNSVIAALIDKP